MKNIQKFEKEGVVVNAILFTGKNASECLEFCTSATFYSGAAMGVCDTFSIVTLKGNTQWCTPNHWVATKNGKDFIILPHDYFNGDKYPMFQ